MLVSVHLHGVLGKLFGRKWNLAVESPAEALRMVNANRPGLADWIRNNQDVYSKYRVKCKYKNGNSELLSDDSYMLERGSLVSISFVPIIEGAGGNGLGQALVGAVLLVVGLAVDWASLGTLAPLGNAFIGMGVSMMIGGVIQMLTPQPKLSRGDSEDPGRRESDYFDGPANTVRQGNPVSLIYGRVLAGSQVVSANVVIEQV